MDLDPVVLGDLLADAGFTREDPVDEHGEFCVRGGIVDWFPAGADNPIRVEFVGETIESIRRYDPSTQRSIETVDQASVVPLTEKVRLRHLLRLPARRSRSVVHRLEEEEVAAQATKLVEQTQASYEEAKAENPRRADAGGVARAVGGRRGRDWPTRRGWISWRSVRRTEAHAAHPSTHRT